VHAADPDVVETIKRTRLPYFTLNGNVCALLGAKAHVNIFIYDPIALTRRASLTKGSAMPQRGQFRSGRAKPLGSVRY